MKPKGQIGAALLGMYVLVLPFLFAFHSSAHQHTTESGSSSELLLSSDAEGCGNCDLFFSHAATIESSAIDLTLPHCYSVASVDVHQQLAVSVARPFERGPPGA